MINEEIRSGRLIVTGMLSLALMVLLLPFNMASAASKDQDDKVEIRVYGLPDISSQAIRSKIDRAVLGEFNRKYPHIRARSATGLEIQGMEMDFLPLLQIAGNIAPDIMYVNFRLSDTYIQQGFLYPLDEFVAELSEEEIGEIPDQIWPIVKRKGPPDGEEHIYAWPIRYLVRTMAYRKDLFQAAGLPDRTPNDWDELMEFARKLHDPRSDVYGLFLHAGDMGQAWEWITFLWSAGGEAMRSDEEGNWYSAFDCDAAAESALFYTRLNREWWVKEHPDGTTQRIRGVVYSDASKEAELWGDGKIGMRMIYLSFDDLSDIQDPEMYGIGPPPAGPTGQRGSEFNAQMMGIYSGVKDPRVREAAWRYIHFWLTDTAQKAMVDTMVENGYGQFSPPALLERFGYYEYVRRIPASLTEAFEEALESGKPEPYGKNSQQIFTWMTRPLGQMSHDPVVLKAIEDGDDETALVRIKAILEEGVRNADERMIGIISPEVMRMRRWVSLGVSILILAVFTVVFSYIWKIFTPPKDDPGMKAGAWQFRKYKVAYLIMFPAIGTIALWQYYPLARGVLMAFQDYRVTGEVSWVYLDNFAEILFSGDFWHSLFVSLKYSFLFILFGFTAPIALAILLQEVPKGKVLYRVIFFLPQVLTGVVVMFLWKSFYRPTGLLNTLLGYIGIEMHDTWFEHPRLALIACLIPVIWAGMGPGCLIYLAALKTIPDDLYEAANIDGASIFHKIIHVTLPSLKALIIINFIGAVIGAFQSSGLILVMTGGGPYTPQGQTLTADLNIFMTAFFFLKFGVATAMAWIIGLMLIGFTVLQLRRLRNMEFRTAQA